MSQGIPITLDYSNAPPISFRKRVKRIEFLPQGTYNQSLSAQDIVRFNLKEARDFIDPWSVRLEITVEVPDSALVDDAKFTHKCLQLDGSAQSFIQNMVWYDPQGRELERINQYGRLANFLMEMKYNPQERGGTDQYGCGGLNLGQLGKQVGAIPAPMNKMRWLGMNQAGGGVIENVPGSWENSHSVIGVVNGVSNTPITSGYSGVPADDTAYGMILDGAFQLTGPFVNQFNAQNQWIQGGTMVQYAAVDGQPNPPSSYPTPPYFAGLTWGSGTQLAGFTNSSPSWATINPTATWNHITTNWSPVTYWSPLRNNSVVWQTSPFIEWDTAIGAGPLGTYNGAPPSTVQLIDAYYGTGVSLCGNSSQCDDPTMLINNLNQTLFYNGPGQGGSLTWDMNTINYGFADPFPANFCSGTYEPIFSKTVKQRVIENGIPRAKGIQQMTFEIQLMSGFLGQLIENYKLVPMAVMKDITLELTFNQYALFTSYHSTNVNHRAYNIKDIRLLMDTMIIEDSALYQAISSQFPNWAFASQSFYLGPQYTIVNNAIPAELQISLRFKSMKNIFFGFYRSLYLKSTAARWNYRLSGNVTSYYIQYGTEVFPSVPFEGNSGTNYGPINNYEFIMQLRNALGYTHTPVQGAINIHNFAVNFSEFNPEDIDATSTQFDKYVKMMDTDNNQLCFFKENRIRGTAMFAVPCEVMEHDKSAWGGLDTEVGSATSLIIKNSMADAYKGMSEFVCWIQYNCIFKRESDGFIVFGRV